MDELMQFLMDPDPATGGEGGEGGGGTGEGGEGGGGTLLADPPAGGQSGGEGGTGEGEGDKAPSTDTPPEWVSQLPDDLRESQTLQKFTSLDQLAKGYLNLQSKLGENPVKIPESDAPQEQWQEYYKAIGVPDKPDGYEMPTEGIPEVVQPSEQQVEAFKHKAHELGLTPKQAAELYRFDLEQASGVMQQTQKQAEQQRQEAESELRKKFGNAYDERLNLARQALKQFGGDDAVQALEKTGAGNDPNVIAMLSEIGKAVHGDSVMGAGSSASFRLAPEEAQSKITQKMNDPEFSKAYLDKNHPQYQDAVKEMRELYEAAYPEQK